MMPSLLHSLVFLAVVAIASAITLILPGATGWPRASVGVLAFGLVGAGVLAQALLLYRASARQLDQTRRELADLAGRTERLEEGLRTLDEATRSGSARSAEMVQEMRVLQTLLGQVVGRGSSGPQDATLQPAAAASSPARVGNTDTDSAASPLGEAELREILRGALSENRVDLYLQPVVALPSRRTTHYECFSRVRGEDGRVVYPKDYIPVAESAGLMGTLDNLLLFRCIQLVRKLGPRRPEASFFCNISSASLHDADFFPQFVEYMASNTELADRLVFEFSHGELLDIGNEERRRLAALGRAGYRFSIDHVESRRIDPQSLADQHVAFVKMDPHILFVGSDEPNARMLRNRLDRRGISLIASKIEEEDQVLDLLEIDIELAQGFLFGEPRPSREDTSAAAAAEAR